MGGGERRGGKGVHMCHVTVSITKGVVTTSYTVQYSVYTTTIILTV